MVTAFDYGHGLVFEFHMLTTPCAVAGILAEGVYPLQTIVTAMGAANKE